MHAEHLLADLGSALAGPLELGRTLQRITEIVVEGGIFVQFMQNQ